jgi:hypothetical protein
MDEYFLSWDFGGGVSDHNYFNGAGLSGFKNGGGYGDGWVWDFGFEDDIHGEYSDLLRGYMRLSNNG